MTNRQETVLKDTGVDLNKQKDIFCSWVGQLNIVNMLVLCWFICIWAINKNTKHLHEVRQVDIKVHTKKT